jgi:hypothetical protein
LIRARFCLSRLVTSGTTYVHSVVTDPTHVDAQVVGPSIAGVFKSRGFAEIHLL